MKFNFGLGFVISFVLLNSTFANTLEGKKLGGRAPNRITTEVFEEEKPEPQEPPATQPPAFAIKFVPLITILAELFKTIMTKFGQFNMANKPPMKRNSTQESETEQTSTNEFFDDAEQEKQQELLECNAANLGLWPDKTNSQRYYKCEIDPRSPALANCVKDYFKGRTENKANFLSDQGLVIPVVKPCFLLSLMKCANGFRYSHKSRICIPDVVFSSS
ncbi:hypothetical protein RUM44_010125 [Polyplax serrata]|uniref:Uncharacterized protein n=1 Tax=Polyplax serrata TaxID=468196 RepID=A0ABR1AUP2_POLSC